MGNVESLDKGLRNVVWKRVMVADRSYDRWQVYGKNVDVTLA